MDIKTLFKRPFLVDTKKRIFGFGYKKRYNITTRFIRRRPITSFLLGLLLLFVLIVLGSVFSGSNKEVPKQAVVKSVQIYQIGTAPRVTIQAKVTKSGVIKIAAQTSGIISSINVTEGQSVDKGTNLVTIGSDYQGDNALDLQQQLAGVQLKNVNDTYQTQKDLISKQRDLANKNAANADELRSISAQSISSTQGLLNLDQDILNTLNQNEQQYMATNSAGQNNQTILQTKQLQSQFQSVVNGLNQSLVSTQYQSASSSAIPQELSDIQKDISLKQLDIQEKTLELNKAVSGLQYLIASVNAETMHPTAPFAGTVERIYVKEGDLVTPGTPLLELSGNAQTVEAVANVPSSLAKNVSRLEMSDLQFGTSSYSEMPAFVSTEATDNGFYAVVYSIPEAYMSKAADGEYIQVSLPIGHADTSAQIPFVPIDSVYQSQSEAYLFVAKNKKAMAKKVTLGEVFGRFVQVTGGLTSGDQVITDRNVVAGDSVSSSRL